MRLPALAGLLWAVVAAAQPVMAERELEVVRQNFDVGNFKDALARATNAMQISNFNDAQRLELHKFAGVSAFNLGDLPAAEKHFLAMLQLNPDYVLDPFAFPPPAIKAFEDVKRKNADTLNLIRQQLALLEEQNRREAAEREKAKALAEEQRRRVEDLAKRVTVKTVEKRAFIVNFIPFGAGQFQQGRTALGIALAASEGALAATSIVAYLAIQLGLFEDKTYDYVDRLGGPFSITVRRIPESRRGEYNVWSAVKYSGGIGFYAIWALGIVDAILHHQDEVVTTESKRLDEVIVPPPPSPSKLGEPHVFLFPTSGGMGAGINVRF